MNFGFIGFGLMGQQRLKSVLRMGGHRAVSVFDPDSAKLASLAADCRRAATWQAVIEDPEVDVVVAAVPHHLTREVCIAGLSAGKHVFSEKPIGRTTAECSDILAADTHGKCFGVGFNYRHYPGIQHAKRLIESGDLGKLTHMRFVLGHAARPGYEKEWKTSKEACGGGALLDPGIHVVDLIRFLGGEVAQADARLFTNYWTMLDVEDNAFLNTETAAGVYTQAHISITEWKNRMSIDIFGADACVQIRGRSGFYGAQVVRLTRRWGWLDKSREEEIVTEYPKEDNSFTEELKLYVERIEGRAAPDLAMKRDAVRALEIVEGVYRQQQTRQQQFAVAV